MTLPHQNRPTFEGTFAIARGRIEKSRRIFQAILHKETAITVLEELMKGNESRYDLVASEEMQRHRKLRSQHYGSYHFLCHANSRHHAGWLVCKFALTGHCPLRNALKKFDTDVGTSTLRNHMKSHTEGKHVDNVSSRLTKVGLGVKRSVADAAVRAVVQGLLPLSFSYRKPGMQAFASALVDAGKSVPFNVSIDIKDLLPCASSIREGVKRLARKEHDSFKHTELENVLSLGGGVTCDGLKQKVNGEKYYDFTIHYFRLGKPDLLTRVREAQLVTKLLFLKMHQGAETAAAIRNTLDVALMECCGIELDCFMDNFTFVTDCAATMPCVVGASASSRRVPFSEKWVGCISHMLNTAMKHVVNHEIRGKTIIADDLERVKTIVRIFKQGGWNSLLPDGHALIQEVETRFGTTHSVVQRFLKSADKVGEIIARKDSETATAAFRDLDRHYTVDGNVSFPALEAIVEAFKPIRHMQTAFEADLEPTMHLVLPMLSSAKTQIRRLQSGMAQGANFVTPHRMTQELCGLVLAELEKLEVHDLWIAACLLHPRMRSLSFISDMEERRVLKMKGTVMIRRMAKKYHKSALQRETGGESNTERDELRLRQNTLGEHSFRLEDAFDMPEFDASESDTLTKYMGKRFSRPVLEGVSNRGGLIKFWVGQEHIYPDLAKVSFRIFATPVSSASSERNFSAVNRILTSDRSRLDSSLLEDLMYARSAVQRDFPFSDNTEDQDSEN